MYCIMYIFRWKRGNGGMPLFPRDTLRAKLKRLIDNFTSYIHQKKSKPKFVREFKGKLSTIFECCTCHCQLQPASCSDRRVNCKRLDCIGKILKPSQPGREPEYREFHFLCDCNPCVPVEDRYY